MSDLLAETLIPITSVPRHLTNAGYRRHDFRVILRWCLHGVGGRKLESIRVRREIYTSVEALRRWMCKRA